MPYFVTVGVVPNSDYFPVLEVKAPLARYMESATPDFNLLMQAPLPLLPMFDERSRAQADPARLTSGHRPWSQRAAWIQQAHSVARYVRSGDASLLASFSNALATDLAVLRAALVECRIRLPDGALARQLGELARGVAVHLPAPSAVSFWRDLAAEQCVARLPAAERRWLELHRAIAARQAADIVAAAEVLLESQPALQGELLAQALAALMAGKILTGEGMHAMRALSKHRARLGAAGRDWAPIFRFLVIHAERS